MQLQHFLISTAILMLLNVCSAGVVVKSDALPQTTNLEIPEKTELLRFSFDESWSYISTAASQLFYVFILSLIYFRSIVLLNVLELFKTLVGMSYLWSFGQIYIIIVITYLVLFAISETLLVITNPFIDDPLDFLSLMGTIGSDTLTVIWAFWPF
ncbi:hypothetical protein ABEB36_006274 [Hypothenemus hampei]|uniref:Uncharacterized protein n=1 Tax=Hypothenemus hampei TaxID=57062 RepID=A0ABD1EPZ5_HYPHA